MNSLTKLFAKIDRRTAIVLFISGVLFLLNNTPVTIFENASLFLFDTFRGLLDPVFKGMCFDIAKLANGGVLQEVIKNTGTQVRAFLYFILLLYLASPFVLELFAKLRKQKNVPDLLFSLGGFIILSLLFIPVLRSMGLGHYAEYTEDPLGLTKPFSSKRLLVPFLSNMLFCRGVLLYNLFSLVLIFLAIFFLKRWFAERKIHISFLNFLSLMTSSFMIFNFQFTGYVDVFVFLLFIIVTTYKFGLHARLAVITMAMLTHEASVFIIIPYILFMVPREEKKYFLSLVLVYVLTYKLFTNASILGMYEHHAILTTESSLAYLHTNIMNAVWGILVAYKLLWIYIFIAIHALYKAREHMDLLKIITFIAFPFAMLNMADTSRLIGYGFLGLLFGIAYLHKKKIVDLERNDLVFNVNLLIPSFYCGLNTGPIMLMGLYKACMLAFSLVQG